MIESKTPYRRPAILLLFAVMFGSAAGCARDIRVEQREAEVLAHLGSRAINVQLKGAGVRYLGFGVKGDQPVRGGESITIEHFWACDAVPPKDFWVFVHPLVQGARGHLAHGDHRPALPMTKWLPGEIYRTTHNLEIPPTLFAPTVDLRVGLYLGRARVPVKGAAFHEGDDRIIAGRLAIVPESLRCLNGALATAVGCVPNAEARLMRTAQAIAIDGEASEEAWQAAPWLEFWRTADSGLPVVRTRAKMLYDQEHLYVYFQSQDPDILGPYGKRDDPIYRSEAVELFLGLDDPAVPLRHYVELQASPNGVRFDARFFGGPRQQMQTAFDMNFQVATAVDGTVDPKAGGTQAPDLDRGWDSEWAIPIADLPPSWLKSHWPPASVRLNLFRVAKDRVGKAKPRPTEVAWSPPMMGDFHNLRRFGSMQLQGLQAAPNRQP